MKFAILALFGLVAVQAVELPTSDELVERRHRRVEQDEEPVEKKRNGRKHRRADEDEMIESEKFFKALGSLGKSGWLTFKHCITIDERC